MLGLSQTCAGTGTDNNDVIVGRDQGTLHWWTGCYSDGADPAFVLRDASGSATGLLRGSTPLNDGSWHHVVALHDAALGEVRLYVDGGDPEDSQSVVFSGDFAGNLAGEPRLPQPLGWLLLRWRPGRGGHLPPCPFPE